MSDSLRPHRWQPTRLCHPWDSPGKNTGVRCHFHLQCMKVKSESEVTQLCLTLHDPMDCSLPGSSAHGIFQARVLEWVAVEGTYLNIIKAIYDKRTANIILNSENLMLNITHYQRNTNQNHNEVSFHASQNGCYPKVCKQ